MSQQKIEQCIHDCLSAMQNLNNLSTKSNDTVLKSTLEESAHHLEMAVHECEFAAKQAP